MPKTASTRKREQTRTEESNATYGAIQPSTLPQGPRQARIAATARQANANVRKGPRSLAAANASKLVTMPT